MKNAEVHAVSTKWKHLACCKVLHLNLVHPMGLLLKSTYQPIKLKRCASTCETSFVESSFGAQSSDVEQVEPQLIYSKLARIALCVDMGAVAYRADLLLICITRRTVIHLAFILQRKNDYVSDLIGYLSQSLQNFCSTSAGVKASLKNPARKKKR